MAVSTKLKVYSHLIKLPYPHDRVSLTYRGGLTAGTPTNLKI